jgi:hypothetical protein
VPYSLVKQQLYMRLSAQVVEIFHKGKLVASHQRSPVKDRPSTVAAHMPKAHQPYLDGRLPFGHHALGFRETLQARLAEVFLLGNGADRIDMLLDIPGHELAVSAAPSLQVNTVVSVTNGADALGDRLALPSETLVLLARGFHVLGNLLQARCRFGGTPWTTLFTRAAGVVTVLLHPLERLFGLRDGLGGRSLFDGHRC